jgi:glycine/D-amino acid oxidase-like deaminating enzyme
MDLRTHYPYSLLKFGIVRSYPSLDQNIKTDVAVIGAGITGALVGYELQKAGVDCVIVDKRHVGMGSTAASTSLIQYEIDTPLHRLIKKVGYKNAVRSYELSREAVHLLKDISDAVGNKGNFKQKRSLQFASSKQDARDLKKEYQLRKQQGFALDFLEESDIRERFGFKAGAALYTREAAEVDAYLLTHKILDKIHPDTPVYDHTNVISIRQDKRKLRLTTEKGYLIEAKHLIIACGYESGRYLKKKIEDLRCTYAMVSEPMQQKEFWEDNCLIWETADPYIYLRATDDQRLLIGGKDTAYFSLQKQLAVLPQKTKALQQSFQKLFPHIPFTIDFKWAGAFAATRDGLPYIGAASPGSKTYFALGYGGNGITFSVIAAQLLTSLIKGYKHPDRELFSFNR